TPPMVPACWRSRGATGPVAELRPLFPLLPGAESFWPAFPANCGAADPCCCCCRPLRRRALVALDIPRPAPLLVMWPLGVSAAAETDAWTGASEGGTRTVRVDRHTA